MKGLLSAAALIAIALVCLTVTRKLERERRLVAKLRRKGAVEPGWALPLEELTDDERDAADSLVASGVLEIRRSDPLGETGRPLGQPGRPMGQPGSPTGQPRRPMGQPGRPIGQPGSPTGQRGKPMGQRVFIRPVELGGFRRKRLRLVVLGGLGAFLLAILVAVLILRR